MARRYGGREVIMLCERCRQREANIKYTEVINGVKTEHNLCAQCAKEMDFGSYYAALFDGDYSVGKLLSGLLGFQPDAEELDEKKINQIACPTCRTTYSEFIKESRFGCPDCYGTFDLLMGEKIKALQGNNTHTGKAPADYHEPAQTRTAQSEKASGDEELSLLNSRLKEAIQEEEYEMAAKYRDAIRELKERMETDV